MSSANPKKVSTNSQTVNYMANTNYQPCLCDLTYSACDAFCCCDEDCPSVSIAIFLFLLVFTLKLKMFNIFCFCLPMTDCNWILDKREKVRQHWLWKCKRTASFWLYKTCWNIRVQQTSWHLEIFQPIYLTYVRLLQQCTADGRLLDLAWQAIQYYHWRYQKDRRHWFWWNNLWKERSQWRFL